MSGNLAASRISGTISAANLPSYVDDVLEYASLSKFPTTGESGKIYTALDTNKIYRWSGNAYVVISETVALGTTHSSAGYGDESRAAYNHSTKTSGNPHHVTKTDVGLGNVDNTADSEKSVKYATSAGSAGSVAWSNVSGRPSSMPASDVYSWAKASSKPSYSWSEISGKPTIPSVGNGTVTITQNGATKGTFTLNQSGNATIALTDNNTVYSLPAATSSTLGGVKVGSNITNSGGTISLTKANVTSALGYTPPTSDTNTWRPEEVIISSSQPNASTCKLWIKV